MLIDKYYQGVDWSRCYHDSDSCMCYLTVYLSICDHLLNSLCEIFCCLVNYVLYIKIVLCLT